MYLPKLLDRHVNVIYTNGHVFSYIKAGGICKKCHLNAEENKIMPEMFPHSTLDCLVHGLFNNTSPSVLYSIKWVRDYQSSM
jgi:hypothetical protein